MELDQLRALLAVVDAGSITRAARQMHMTQPALSLKLKALEQRLGVALLARNHEGVQPTAEGQMAYETARRVLDLCDTLPDRVRPCEGPPMLSVGATPTMGGYVLPHIIGRFMTVEPDVKVNLTVTHLTGVVEQVEDGLLRIGFVEGPLYVPGLTSEEIGEDELRLVASPRFGAPDQLDEQTALALPHVFCIPQCGMRQVLERYLLSRGRRGGDLKVVAELDSLDAVKALVEGGAGVAWLSTRCVKREVQAGSLRILTVPGTRIIYPYVAVFQSARGLCPIGQRYVGLVRERLRPHRKREAQ